MRRLWERQPLDTADCWPLNYLLFHYESDAWFFRGHVVSTRVRKRLYRLRNTRSAD